MKILNCWVFQDIHYEEFKFPTLFFGQSRKNQGIKMPYQIIAQWELLHKNHDFATHIPSFFLKVINVFSMICQLGPPLFFVTFISVESKWPLSLQCLYEFNSKKLGFDMLFDKLEMKHITNLIQSNFITCAYYFDHLMKCFPKLCMKEDTIFGPWIFSLL